MNGIELFRKLGMGAKFNFRRFGADAERLKIIKPKENNIQNADKSCKKRKLEEMLLIANHHDGSNNQTTNEDHDNFDGSDDSNTSTEFEDDDLVDANVGINNVEEESDDELHLVGSIVSKTSNDDTRHSRKRKKKTKGSETLLKDEKVRHIRKQNAIHVFGTDVVTPYETFEQLSSAYNINQHLIANISKAGYKTPTPIQMQAIPVMLERREILACAPTGSGKTAAFLIPLLHYLREHRKDGFRALILSPTRELARQTYNECYRLCDGLNLRVHLIDKVKSTKLKAKSHQKFDLLVTTPNRLVFLLRQDPPIVSLHSVEWLVVDESDKLFESGKRGFRDQLAEIYSACDSGNVRHAMFSATFTSEVEKWCTLNLDNVVQVYIGSRNSAVESIKQQLLFVGSESGKLLALRDMIRKGIQPPVLIFVQSKERAKELFHELIYDGLNVDVIHADRTKLQRDNVVRSFRQGKVWILICTELMGRGIDFKGISLVINYDFPNSAISYIHRIGRTGRAGHTGEAVTFFTENDAVNLRSIANVMKEAGCPVPDYMLHMHKPSRKERQRLANSAPPRDSIRTIPKQEIEAARKFRHSKKKQIQRAQGKKNGLEGGSNMSASKLSSLSTKHNDSGGKK